MALGEVTLADWWRVMRREILSGLLLGLILGGLGFLRVCTWQAFAHAYGDYWLLLAVVVSLSLMGVVLWGSLVGSMLPFLLRRLGADPASSSAPFVSTLVDVTGLRSEEHTSELQSLMRTSYAVFCLKKKKTVDAS